MEYLMSANCLIYKGEETQMCLLMLFPSYNGTSNKKTIETSRQVWTNTEMLGDPGRCWKTLLWKSLPSVCSAWQGAREDPAGGGGQPGSYWSTPVALCCSGKAEESEVSWAPLEDVTVMKGGPTEAWNQAK